MNRYRESKNRLDPKKPKPKITISDFFSEFENYKKNQNQTNFKNLILKIKEISKSLNLEDLSFFCEKSLKKDINDEDRKIVVKFVVAQLTNFLNGKNIYEFCDLKEFINLDKTIDVFDKEDYIFEKYNSIFNFFQVIFKILENEKLQDYLSNLNNLFNFYTNESQIKKMDKDKLKKQVLTVLNLQINELLNSLDLFLIDDKEKRFNAIVDDFRTTRDEASFNDMINELLKIGKIEQNSLLINACNIIKKNTQISKNIEDFLKTTNIIDGFYSIYFFENNTKENFEKILDFIGENLIMEKDILTDDFLITIKRSILYVEEEKPEEKSHNDVQRIRAITDIFELWKLEKEIEEINSIDEKLDETKKEFLLNTLIPQTYLFGNFNESSNFNLISDIFNILEENQEKTWEDLKELKKLQNLLIELGLVKDGSLFEFIKFQNIEIIKTKKHLINSLSDVSTKYMKKYIAERFQTMIYYLINRDVWVEKVDYSLVISKVLKNFSNSFLFFDKNFDYNFRLIFEPNFKDLNMAREYFNLIVNKRKDIENDIEIFSSKMEMELLEKLILANKTNKEKCENINKAYLLRLLNLDLSKIDDLIDEKKQELQEYLLYKTYEETKVTKDQEKIMEIHEKLKIYSIFLEFLNSQERQETERKYGFSMDELIENIDLDFFVLKRYIDLFFKKEKISFKDLTVDDLLDLLKKDMGKIDFKEFNKTNILDLNLLSCNCFNSLKTDRFNEKLKKTLLRTLLGASSNINPEFLEIIYVLKDKSFEEKTEIVNEICSDFFLDDKIEKMDDNYILNLKKNILDGSVASDFIERNELFFQAVVSLEINPDYVYYYLEKNKIYLGNSEETIEKAKQENYIYLNTINKIRREIINDIVSKNINEKTYENIKILQEGGYFEGIYIENQDKIKEKSNEFKLRVSRDIGGKSYEEIVELVRIVTGVKDTDLDKLKKRYSDRMILEEKTNKFNVNYEHGKKIIYDAKENVSYEEYLKYYGRQNPLAYLFRKENIKQLLFYLIEQKYAKKMLKNPNEKTEKAKNESIFEAKKEIQEILNNSILNFLNNKQIDLTKEQIEMISKANLSFKRSDKYSKKTFEIVEKTMGMKNKELDEKLTKNLSDFDIGEKENIRKKQEMKKMLLAFLDDNQVFNGKKTKQTKNYKKVSEFYFSFLKNDRIVPKILTPRFFKKINIFLETFSKKVGYRDKSFLFGKSLLNIAKVSSLMYVANPRINSWLINSIRNSIPVVSITLALMLIVKALKPVPVLNLKFLTEKKIIKKCLDFLANVYEKNKSLILPIIFGVILASDFSNFSLNQFVNNIKNPINFLNEIGLSTASVPFIAFILSKILSSKNLDFNRKKRDQKAQILLIYEKEIKTFIFKYGLDKQTHGELNEQRMEAFLRDIIDEVIFFKKNKPKHMMDLTTGIVYNKLKRQEMQRILFECYDRNFNPSSVKQYTKENKLRKKMKNLLYSKNKVIRFTSDYFSNYKMYVSTFASSTLVGLITRDLKLSSYFALGNIFIPYLIHSFYFFKSTTQRQDEYRKKGLDSLTNNLKAMLPLTLVLSRFSTSDTVIYNTVTYLSLTFYALYKIQRNISLITFSEKNTNKKHAIKILISNPIVIKKFIEKYDIETEEGKIKQELETLDKSGVKLNFKITDSKKIENLFGLFYKNARKDYKLECKRKNQPFDLNYFFNILSSLNDETKIEKYFSLSEKKSGFNKIDKNSRKYLTMYFIRGTNNENANSY